MERNKTTITILKLLLLKQDMIVYMQNLKGAIDKLLEISEYSKIVNTGQQTLTVFLYTTNKQLEN